MATDVREQLRNLDIRVDRGPDVAGAMRRGRQRRRHRQVGFTGVGAAVVAAILVLGPFTPGPSIRDLYVTQTDRTDRYAEHLEAFAREPTDEDELPHRRVPHGADEEDVAFDDSRLAYRDDGIYIYLTPILDPDDGRERLMVSTYLRGVAAGPGVIPADIPQADGAEIVTAHADGDPDRARHTVVILVGSSFDTATSADGESIDIQGNLLVHSGPDALEPITLTGSQGERETTPPTFPGGPPP